MQVNPSIFKAYDIRGIYPTDLNEQVAYLVGRAFATFLSVDRVLVGHDMRLSGPALLAEVTRGLLDQGADVVDIGMVSTDQYYYACATLGLPGIMVTASHNPKAYNGFKMVKKMPYLLSGDEGIQDLRRLVESEDFPEAPERGRVIHEDLKEGFVQKVLSIIDASAIKPLKVVVDTGNGMVGPILQEVYGHLPVQLVGLYLNPDGNLPNHGLDPLQPENRAELQKRVVSEGAAIGFAFDGDGDRFFAIDDRGNFIPGDFLTAILGQYLLAKHPNSKVLYDVRASWAVVDLITAVGGTPLMERVGHAFIKRRMAEENAVFAGEVTGHYYFRDFFFADSGIVPSLLIMELLSTWNVKMSDLLTGLEMKYFISGEINSTVADPKAVLKKLTDTYADGQQHTMDGISVTYPTWHFNVRASNTEPLVRLNLEAKTQAEMEKRRDEVMAIIRGDVADTRVLVVDDEKLFIDLVAGHLRQNHYSVETASSGEAALNILKAEAPYALLITDLNMPGMGGLDLLRLARGHDPALEVIVFTADDNVATAVAAMREYGAYDYLLKPLNPNTRLLAAVERAVEHRRLNLEREALKSEVIAHAGRLQALIASTDDAILSADSQNVVTIINPATLQLFGRKPLVGNDALTALPTPFAKLVRNWLDVLHRQAALVEMEWGPNAHYRVSLVPLSINGDDLGGWVMVISDVSHFKRLEEFRLHLLHDAANRIQLPLFNALSTVAELESLPDSQNSRAIKALLGLSRHLSQIRLWVDEVLVTARMDGGIGLQLDYLDVGTVVHEWGDATRDSLRERDPRLRLVLAENLPRLYADRELFVRLLRQLLEQGRHATQVDQQHQLTLNFYQNQGQLWIDSFLEGPTVRDTGTLRLSGLHSTPDQPLSELAQVVTLAGKLGGQVWIRSRRPVGSALSICLPAPAELAQNP